MLLVMDGLGGFRTVERGSELAEARTPNLDRLAREGSLGLHDPVTRGITPGSGAGHLGLFGYDPLAYEIGRGALSAAGIGFELRPGDVAARVNFCNLAPDGTIADRRAGRLPTEEAARICELLMREVKLDGAELFLRPEREHRGLLVLRGDGLDPSVTDTDPQREGVPPLKPETTAPEAKRTAELIASVLDQARSLLAGRDRGNYLLVRGFDTHKELPSFPDRYKLRALAIATYPMYLGISRLLGFDTHQVEGAAPEEVDALERLSPEADFVFMHVKKTDSAGEDGDFERKVQAIEEVDALVPRMRWRRTRGTPSRCCCGAGPRRPTGCPASTRSTAGRARSAASRPSTCCRSCSPPRNGWQSTGHDRTLYRSLHGERRHGS